MNHLKLLFNRKKNNKGFTLVELLCAIAVMSLVVLGVTSIFVVSSKTFARGTSEIDVQQEAQFAASIISDLLMDCDEAPTYDGTTGEWVIKKGTETYYFYVDSTTNELKVRYNGITEVIAQGVNGASGFSLDTTNFTNNKSVTLSFNLTKGDRAYESSYELTSRNGDTVAVVNDGSANILTADKLYVEPCQSLPLEISVSGISDQSVSIQVLGRTDPETVATESGGMHTLKIGKNETASEITLVIKTVATKTGTTIPAGTKTVTAYIRRINSMTIDGHYLDGGAGEKTAGARYEITATPTGTNLSQNVSGEIDYVYPQTIKWDVKFYENGLEKPNTGDEFFTIESEEKGSSGYTSKIIVKLNKNVENNYLFSVFAEAMHPLGKVTHSRGLYTDLKTNKSELPYVGTTSEYNSRPIVERFDIMNAAFAYDPSKMYRGSDAAQATFNLYDSVKNTQLPAVKGSGTYKARLYHRYREIYSEDPVTKARTYGPWITWIDENPGDGNDSISINLRPIATEVYEPMKYYQIEIRAEFYDESKSNAIVWPFDDTPKSAYYLTDTIEPIKNVFNLRVNGATTSISNDSILKGSYDIKKNDSIVLSLEDYRGINRNTEYYRNMGFNFYKYDGTEWIPYFGSTINRTYHSVRHYDDQYDELPVFSISFAEAGTYKAVFTATGFKKAVLKPNGTYEESRYNTPFELINPFNGAGEFFFTVSE